MCQGEELGQWEEAVACYARAIELADRRASYLLNRAMALAKLERFAEAREDLVKAVERNASLTALLPAITDLDRMRREGWLDGIVPSRRSSSYPSGHHPESR